MKTYLAALFGLIVIYTAFAAKLAYGHDTVAEASVLKPLLPPPEQTRNVVPLSPEEQLGKDIFFDATLSNPEGYSCATCHVPQAGFTGPSSVVNIIAGPVPGVVAGRYGRRKPQSIPYSTFCPDGPYFIAAQEGGTFVGGTFWDGRMMNDAEQARMPFLDQNEMANTPEGPYPPHAGGYSPLVARKVQSRPYAQLFENVFGGNVFSNSTDGQIYDLVTTALTVYEASAEINQFSSKWDASTNGTPPMNLYTFTPSEENGRQLFFGAAQCFQCHTDAGLPSFLKATGGKETFTMYCYANIGSPRNPENPFYLNTNCDSNPDGCNPTGTNFIDYGMGANPNPAPDGTIFYNIAPGDIIQNDGLFKAPSLRNVDMRPYPGFVKCYTHNGYFKSLEDIVHWYNKRNIATNMNGEEQAFDWYSGPPEGFTPIFPPPENMEFSDNVQNIVGVSPAQYDEHKIPDGGLVSGNAQIGNLQLTAQEETDLVNFLKTLTDGYMKPNPAPPNLSYALAAKPQPSVSSSFVVQLAGPIGGIYLVQTSTNLADWHTVSTNILTDSSINITNTVIAGATAQYWRAVRKGRFWR